MKVRLIAFIVAKACCLSLAAYAPPPFETPPEIFGEVLLESQIRICSWNINQFGANRDAVNTSQLADIVTRLQCDIIAIIEVTADDGVKAMAQSLNTRSNTTWVGNISEPTGPVSRKEAIAFLWNDMKIAWLQDGGTIAGSGMQRPPVAHRFAAKNVVEGPAFDFILVALHTRPATLRADMTALGRDLNNLASANQKEPDIIVVGDFNTAPSNQLNSNWRQAFNADKIPAITSGSTMATESNALNDNMVWGPPTVENYAGIGDSRAKLGQSLPNPKAGTVEFESYYDNSHSRLSDHRPIWADFWSGPDNSDPQ